MARGDTSAAVLAVHLPRCGSDTTPGSIAARYCGACLAATCDERKRYGGGH
jgi:hypothetical protein